MATSEKSTPKKAKERPASLMVVAMKAGEEINITPMSQDERNARIVVLRQVYNLVARLIGYVKEAKVTTVKNQWGSSYKAIEVKLPTVYFNEESLITLQTSLDAMYRQVTLAYTAVEDESGEEDDEDEDDDSESGSMLDSDDLGEDESEDI